MHKEYADPKMKKTVKNLWDFYKKECDGLTQISREEDEEADRKLRSKYKDILEAKKSAKKYEKYNLDDSRRYVIHFYFHMADIYFNNIIGNHCLKTTKKLLFYYWDETNNLTSRAVNITSLAGANSAPTVAKQILKLSGW